MQQDQATRHPGFGEYTGVYDQRLVCAATLIILWYEEYYSFATNHDNSTGGLS